ncbi:MAG: hypothetical protein JWP10_445 [Nocardioidaceae bacterium]|nr:hypothetical protein [Nocardioidaceae bacterium]
MESVVAAHPYLGADVPLALAHRGGAKYAPNAGIENTIAAFRNALDLGYRYLETDVYVSSDGVVYAFHDHDLARLTGHAGGIETLTSEEIDQVLVAGSEPIPRLADVLQAFPEARFNIDFKSAKAVKPTVQVVADHHAQGRVCFASFEYARLRRARLMASWAATSASPVEIALVKVSPVRWIRSIARKHGVVAFQVPHRRHGITIVTPTFIRRAHELGIQVHVWTIDDREEMSHLLDLGVDGIVTDRIDILKELLVSRGQWKDAA